MDLIHWEEIIIFREIIIPVFFHGCHKIKLITLWHLIIKKTTNSNQKNPQNKQNNKKSTKQSTKKYPLR